MKKLHIYIILIGIIIGLIIVISPVIGENEYVGSEYVGASIEAWGSLSKAIPIPPGTKPKEFYGDDGCYAEWSDGIITLPNGIFQSVWKYTKSDGTEISAYTEENGSTTVIETHSDGTKTVSKSSPPSSKITVEVYDNDGNLISTSTIYEPWESYLKRVVCGDFSSEREQDELSSGYEPLYSEDFAYSSNGLKSVLENLNCQPTLKYHGYYKDNNSEGDDVYYEIWIYILADGSEVIIKRSASSNSAENGKVTITIIEPDGTIVEMTYQEPYTQYLVSVSISATKDGKTSYYSPQNDWNAKEGEQTVFLYLYYWNDFLVNILCERNIQIGTGGLSNTGVVFEGALSSATGVSHSPPPTVQPFFHQCDLTWTSEVVNAGSDSEYTRWKTTLSDGTIVEVTIGSDGTKQATITSPDGTVTVYKNVSPSNETLITVYDKDGNPVSSHVNSVVPWEMAVAQLICTIENNSVIIPIEPPEEEDSVSYSPPPTVQPFFHQCDLTWTSEVVNAGSDSEYTRWKTTLSNGTIVEVTIGPDGAKQATITSPDGTVTVYKNVSPSNETLITVYDKDGNPVSSHVNSVVPWEMAVAQLICTIENNSVIIPIEPPKDKSITGTDCIELKIFEKTNEAYTGGDYTWDNELVKLARAHSKNMCDKQTFSHNIDGKESWDRLKAAGYSYSNVAENIVPVCGSSGSSSSESAVCEAVAADAMSSWMKSNGHKANILNVHPETGTFQGRTNLGVGVYLCPNCPPDSGCPGGVCCGHGPCYLITQVFTKPTGSSGKDNTMPTTEHTMENTDPNKTSFIGTYCPNPDLTITRLSVPDMGTAGLVLEISLTVANQGSATSDSAPIGVSFTQGKTSMNPQETVPPLNPGETTDISFTTTVPASSEGLGVITVTVDPDNAQAECNEYNNEESAATRMLPEGVSVDDYKKQTASVGYTATGGTGGGASGGGFKMIPGWILDV